MGRGRESRSRRPGEEPGRGGAVRAPEKSSPRHRADLHRYGTRRRRISEGCSNRPDPRRDDTLPGARDRKSTRLNSSHRTISYAVFCLKKKKKKTTSIYVIIKIIQEL